MTGRGLRRLEGPRPGPLLAPDAGGAPWLAVVIGVLCFLACLAAMGAAAADRAADGWARQLRGEATVLVRPRADETATVAAARAAETLGGVAGVEEAAALTVDEARALLRPWLGESLADDLPLPMMVTVRLDPTAPASAPTLSRALADACLDAVVDDHTLWRAGVERSALTLVMLAGAAFLLVAGAAGAAVAYAAEAGVAGARPTLAVLMLNGAADATVAGLFQRRFALIAGQAALVGALTAAGLVAVLRLLGGDGGLTPALPLAWRDLLLIAPCPLIAFTVAALAARLAAGRALASVEEA